MEVREFFSKLLDYCGTQTCDSCGIEDFCATNIPHIGNVAIDKAEKILAAQEKAEAGQNGLTTAQACQPQKDAASTH